MGQFVPDRLFWAREVDEDVPADGSADDTEGAAGADAPGAARADEPADDASGGLPPARATAH